MIDLDHLARTLGTTVEHLWGALLRQAPISGAFDLLFCIFTACAIYGTYRLWLWVHNKVEKHEWEDISYIFPGFVSVVALIMLITALRSLPTMAAAFLNPDYWALRQVLSAVQQ